MNEMANDAEYLRMLDEVKRELATSRSRAALAVNSELVCMHWRIGVMIGEHAIWGNGFVESLSHDIRLAYPGIRGFSVRNLKYMLRFAREYDYETVQQLVARLP